jgi:hypothetical protein
MKLKSLINGALSAIALTFLVPGRANATLSGTYHAGDWLLGFYSTSFNDDFVIDLNDALNESTINPNQSFTLLNTTSHLGTDLSLAGSGEFGSTWYTNAATTGLYYAIIQTSGAPGNSLELTNPDTANIGPWGSQSGQGPVSNDVIDVGQAASSQTQATGQTSVGLWQARSASESWYDQVAPTSSGATLGNTYTNQDSVGDGSISGLVNTSLELDFLQNSETQPAQPILGTFSIDSAGDVTYTALAVVPEPSALAAIGAGAVFLALQRRRRRA